MVRLHTVVTEVNYKTFRYFNQSAHLAGLPYAVLGVNDRSMRESSAIKNRKGYGVKLRYMRQVCEEVKDKETLMVFVDGYDTLFVNANTTEEDLEHAFERAIQNSRNLRTSAAPNSGFIVRPPEIIASGEVNCWPDQGLKNQYFHYSEGMTMRYLNSGFLMGRASAFLRLFEAKAFTGEEQSDQRYFTQALLSSKNNLTFPSIDVDYRCEIVTTITKKSKTLLSLRLGQVAIKGKLSSKSSRRFAHPLFLHLAHNKDLMKQALQQLHGNKGVEEISVRFAEQEYNESVARCSRFKSTRCFDTKGGAYIFHTGEFAQELIMALPAAYAHWLAGNLVATRGCGSVRSFYYFSPTHSDDLDCTRGFDRGGMRALGWDFHSVRIPPRSQWRPPPLRARYAKGRIATPSGRELNVSAPVVLVANKYNTEWGCVCKLAVLLATIYSPC